MSLFSVSCQFLNSIPWDQPTEKVFLERDAIHVWVVEQDKIDDKTISAFDNYLDKLEKEKASRYVKQSDRTRYQLANGLLKELLSKYLGQHPKRFTIDRKENGKPQLPDIPGIQFNSSHSNGTILLAFAFGEQLELGVDIEHLNPSFNYKKIVDYYFSSEEQEVIAKGEGIWEFFRFWTNKEAILKTCGEGLIDNIKELQVYKTENQYEAPVKALQGKHYFLNYFRINEYFMCSVASNRDKPIKVFVYN